MSGRILKPEMTVPATGGKISIGGGVAGAVDAAKAAGLPTVGTA